MSVKTMDRIFSRWFLDGEFRAQMNENPELALAGYDLTDTEKEKVSRLSRTVRSQAKAKRHMVPAVPPKSPPVSLLNYVRSPAT